MPTDRTECECQVRFSDDREGKKTAAWLLLCQRQTAAKPLWQEEPERKAPHHPAKTLSTKINTMFAFELITAALLSVGNTILTAHLV